MIDPSESGKEEQQSFSIIPFIFGAWAVFMVGVVSVFVLLWMTRNMGQREVDHVARIRSTCAPIDTFVVREQFVTGHKNTQIAYRLMQYERFRCGRDVETLRTYLSSDNSRATNVPHAIPELPEELPQVKDTALLRSIDSGLGPLLGKSAKRNTGWL